ncbi:Wzz/FepE/Etk N-terminal domain-containing protein [Erythrobacter sp. sf7]|uniref:Wzz/FepE/Etk N-terminal domain-containing protein n=1 Tax=Erythrobacter fulvus TaxID=2987523 RepID=A0ABT5JMJ7_9SPHN|nr:Wzz/FepE/Etk N-terminal domain-containing protein [Erythrobacter fulvus]MDC8753615.1 Wzz/FepE/Etk N-terminal domain-containing protein [Erythrobacter fulvus]
MRDDEYEAAGAEGGNLLMHLPAVLRERYLLVVIPALLLSIAGIAAAFILPTVYRSTATLLVESPQLPEDVLGDQGVDIIDQRIAKFRQQVLSRPRLIELIQKHRLYTDERAAKSLSEIIEDMRGATRIEPVSAQFERGAGRSTTIAFSLSFDYETASLAQAVAQDMTEQVLLLDATKSSEQAESTVQFLTDQAASLQTQIADAEKLIEQIKAQNGLALSNPGMMAMGGNSGSFDVQIIALQRDNALLQAQRAARQTAAERDPIVAAAEADLAAAQARYSEDHPDIAIAKRRLREAERLAASNQAKLPPDTVDQQIAANSAQIEAIRAMKAQELARLSTAQRAMAQAPLVEQQIAQEQQKLDLLNQQYESVSTRLMQAQGSARAESEQKGERLSVIDPPVVADEPISPNRPLLIAGGIAAGLGAGLLLALAAELFFRPIRDMADIQAVTGTMPLVAIPTIGEPREGVWKRTRSLLPRRRGNLEDSS